MFESFSKQPTGGSPIAAMPDEKGFAKIEMLLEATGGLSLSQVCAVTGLEGSTIQNWVKRGWVEHPVGKKYEEVHVARILIINALKECIKLEHIAKLMSYINGEAISGSEAVIKESTLYTYLCEALKQSSQSLDNSRKGIEGVIDNVIKDYKDPDPNTRGRIRKALILMMFACVCTDVKRRTEAMMGQILREFEEGEAPPKPSFSLPPLTSSPPEPQVAPTPEPQIASTPEPQATPTLEPQVAPAPEPQTDPTPPPAVALRPGISLKPLVDENSEGIVLSDIIETRKTVSQALREWDISSVEKVIIDHDAEAQKKEKAKAEEDAKKSDREPWYVRKK